MARSDAVLRELDQLKAELGRVSAAVGATASAAAAAASSAREAVSDAGAEAASAVRDRLDLADLEKGLAAEIERAEDFAEDHPLILAGAALLLGIAIGRLWGAR